MAPEINKTSCHRINEKVDVYSFGIVVLEIISGREREDFSQRFRPEEKHLCDWARDFDLKKNISAIGYVWYFITLIFSKVNYENFVNILGNE